MYDVAIIGAGVVGGLIARELSKYRLKIVILEREYDVAMGASKANSAIVHAGFDAKPGTLKALLNVRGSEMYEALSAELGVAYSRNGALVVGTDQELDMLNELKKRGETNRVKGLSIISGEKLRELEPHLNREMTAALFVPTSALTCPFGLTVAAIGNAMDNGTELRLGFRVTSIRRTSNCYELSSFGESVEARYYINCAGLHSGEVYAMVGGEPPAQIPRAGEYLLLDKECGGLARHTIFPTPTKAGKGVLVTPTVHGNLMLGPCSIVRDDPDNLITTPAGLNDVIERTKKTFLNIPYNKVITSFTGLRSVDDDFIILPGDRCVNLMRIGSPGLSAAPAIAEHVRDMLADIGLELVPRKDFNPNREPYHNVSEMSADELNLLIKKDKRYGRIICRCEGVSEGEIVEAIHRNPGARDLDGIKRRTRGGMGRCQGGFCSPYVLEIISRERGIQPEEVTKSGRNSFVLTGKTKETC